MAENSSYEVELKLVILPYPISLSVTADPGSLEQLPLPDNVRLLLEKERPYCFEVQHDTYYTHPQVDIAGCDQVLRHRQNILFVRKKDRWELKSNRDIMTWKGVVQTAGSVKCREEVEGDISAEVLAIFHKLGFFSTLEIRKHRWIGKVGAITMSLDAVADLGLFLELEILTHQTDHQAAITALKHFLEQHGLSVFAQEPRSYAQLLQEKS